MKRRRNIITIASIYRCILTQACSQIQSRSSHLDCISHLRLLRKYIWFLTKFTRELIDYKYNYVHKFGKTQKYSKILGSEAAIPYLKATFDETTTSFCRKNMLFVRKLSICWGAKEKKQMQLTNFNLQLITLRNLGKAAFELTNEKIIETAI